MAQPLQVIDVCQEHLFDTLPKVLSGRRIVDAVRDPVLALGLLSFPVGTIINGYILYLLFSKKGERVFSADYQAIVDATPHIKYKTSIIVWIFLVLLLLMIGAAVIVPMLNK